MVAMVEVGTHHSRIRAACQHVTNFISGSLPDHKARALEELYAAPRQRRQWLALARKLLQPTSLLDAVVRLYYSHDDACVPFVLLETGRHALGAAPGHTCAVIKAQCFSCLGS